MFVANGANRMFEEAEGVVLSLHIYSVTLQKTAGLVHNDKQYAWKGLYLLLNINLSWPARRSKNCFLLTMYLGERGCEQLARKRRNNSLLRQPLSRSAVLQLYRNLISTPLPSSPGMNAILILTSLYDIFQTGQR